jgi:hypothetical protein
MSRPKGHSAAGMIMSMKNSNATIGNRSRDLRCVAQCLNHCATACPLNVERIIINDETGEAVTVRSMKA